jgi:hypothetical protein
LLKVLDLRLALARAPVEIGIDHTPLVQVLAHDGQKRGELRKD